MVSTMGNGSLLSIGCAAVEAGISVSRMVQALREVGASPIVEIDHIPHFAAGDVERAIECVHGQPCVGPNVEIRSAKPRASRLTRRN